MKSETISKHSRCAKESGLTAMSRLVAVDPLRGVEASFSKTAGNKILEFGGASPSSDPTRCKMESFYSYLI
jgi:hypothetical protein